MGGVNDPLLSEAGEDILEEVECDEAQDSQSSVVQVLKSNFSDVYY